ncbi:hypothetical protein OVA24_05195 [Luteolibacter sp. SL250]|uniref:hypothetical protein n=1 Tax=Luteolibacter sp. SL250 TaxID=2995170 RepID=UPI0022708572|nr:hypothetical protein [Luteolibacter sp. SL250]WAC20776.1 hypothetical protein OVA24_05195 [Luteolibacter sp. SL250]
MKTRPEAIARVKELAFKGMRSARILRILEKEGYGGLLDLQEVEALANEAAAAKSLMPRGPGKTLPRVFGTIAILAGIGAMMLGDGYHGRHSPAGYGLIAIILGGILVLKPCWGSSEIK